MVLLIILIISEFLTFLVFRQHYKGFSRTKYFLSTLINAILSAFMWFLYIEVAAYEGDFDNPAHIWLIMSLTGAFCAVLFPRVVLDVLHFTGRLINIRRKNHIRLLTNIGIIAWIVIFLIIVAGTLTRFRYKVEEVSIETGMTNRDLDGLTIVHISDIHLSGFYRHGNVLAEMMKKINSFNPDIIINSGDFVSYGWKEFGRGDTILSMARARLGKFAALGNHDIGTYHPGYSAAGRDTNILRMSELITSSGYTLLKDTSIFFRAGETRIGIAGIITRGRHPRMEYGDLKKAIAGLDSADYRILISHDPNLWDKQVAGKTNIDLTLSGHTHGMQMGVNAGWFRWSPSKYFYPRWNGHYSEGIQHLYVNRGLGVLAIPFRIWMPPEITVIRLKAEAGS